jgi:single-stranded DNA-binding protein
MTTATKSAIQSAPAPVRAPISTKTVEKGKSMVVTVGHQDFIKMTYAKSGLEILKFSAGQNDRNNPDAPCVWHNIEMFGEEAVKAYTKIGQGDLIGIRGSVKASEYTSKATNLSAVYFSFSAYHLNVIEKKSAPEADEAVQAEVVEVEVVIDNIPF